MKQEKNPEDTVTIFISLSHFHSSVFFFLLSGAPRTCGWSVYGIYSFSFIFHSSIIFFFLLTGSPKSFILCLFSLDETKKTTQRYGDENNFLSHFHSSFFCWQEHQTPLAEVFAETSVSSRSHSSSFYMFFFFLLSGAPRAFFDRSVCRYVGI